MYGYVVHDIYGVTLGQTLKIQWFFLTDTHLRDSHGRDNLRKFYGNLDGKKPNGERLFAHRKNYSYRYTWMKYGGREADCGSHVEEIDEPTSFLDHVNLGCNHVFLLEELKKTTRAGKPHAKTVAWSHDMEGPAQKIVERYCELANKKTEQLHKVSSPWMITISRKRSLNQMENNQKYAS